MLRMGQRRLDGLDERRHLYSGFGDSLVQAFEFAATPFLFGWIGHVLDVRLGTNPALTIALVLFALIGLGVRAYYGYEAAMQAHEAEAPWAKLPRPDREPGGDLDGVPAGPPSAAGRGPIAPHAPYAQDQPLAAQ